MTMGDSDRRLRFRLAVQQTRAVCYLIAAAIGPVFVALGVLEISLGRLLALTGAAVVSAAGCWLLVRIGAADRLGVVFEWLWLLVDAALITVAVVYTGGADSPWFPWYLANIGAAAFVLGQRAAFAVAVLDTASYTGALVAIGDVGGFDVTLYRAIAQMAFLYGASFLFLRGVSLLKRRQTQLFRLRQDEAIKVDELTRLARALDQRTQELAEATLRTVEADRLKSRFLATMSHELRTPLNSIIGFSDVLLQRLPAGAEEKQRRFLQNIHSSGEHLLKIINDLLDLSKIEAGRMELHIEPVDVAALVHGVCAVAQGGARARRIAFELETPTDLPPVEADQVKLKQVLFNLISNAVKFSHEGGTVRIGTAVRELADRPAVEIRVVDDGIGIDPRHHRTIFEEFRQVDDGPARASGGTGLGLALVRRLVELHHGTVELDSAPGLGSTFAVTVPVSFQGEGEGPGAGPATLDLSREGGTRVLVVEDDPTAYEAISGHLVTAGYIPVRARNADEALRFAHLLHPAAITLDIILPDLDGWEILRRLKDEPATADIPVIMVSVLDNRELAITLGAADYLTKPVDGERLVRRLAELAPRHGRHCRVLLIDDDPLVHELVEARLEPLGYFVVHAVSGRAGLEAAGGSPSPDLILLDLMMPEMDGFEVAARLKADARTSPIPIVVLTARQMTAAERDRLRDKIEALVGKLELPAGGLPAVVESVLSRPRREVQRV